MWEEVGGGRRCQDGSVTPNGGRSWKCWAKDTIAKRLPHAWASRRARSRPWRPTLRWARTRSATRCKAATPRQHCRRQAAMPVSQYQPPRRTSLVRYARQSNGTTAQVVSRRCWSVLMRRVRRSTGIPTRMGVRQTPTCSSLAKAGLGRHTRSRAFLRNSPSKTYPQSSSTTGRGSRFVLRRSRLSSTRTPWRLKLAETVSTLTRCRFSRPTFTAR